MRRRVRSVVEVMYLDAADSWIVNTTSPAPRTVWATDYTTTVPGEYRAFVVWCRVWRYPAVLFGLITDGVKFFLIHPVRGPLFLAATGAATAAAVWG